MEFDRFNSATETSFLFRNGSGSEESVGAMGLRWLWLVAQSWLLVGSCGMVCLNLENLLTTFHSTLAS